MKFSAAEEEKGTNQSEDRRPLPQTETMDVIELLALEASKTMKLLEDCQRLLKRFNE